jgi:hypothetical protein
MFSKCQKVALGCSQSNPGWRFERTQTSVIRRSAGRLDKILRLPVRQEWIQLNVPIDVMDGSIAAGEFN